MAVPRRRRERKLPVQQLSILAICRFAEPLATTSLLPYLPELVQSFGVPQNDIGKWAGFLSAAFSISQAVMGIPWGRFSDIYGRKISILIGLFSTMCTSLFLGMSSNLPMAFVARALAGAGNGNVGILRTTVAEMVPYKELQPKAFSIMPLVWTIGSIFGPMLGGLLANPFDVKPGEKRAHPNPFEQFPYLLPNLVSAIFFAVGITIGFFFLEETLETLRGHRDIGLRLGDKMVYAAKRLTHRLVSVFDAPKSGETDPLLKPSAADEENVLTAPKSSKKANQTRPSLREVMNKQSAIVLLSYTILALHSLAYDQVLPVYMKRDPIGEPGSTPYSPPLQFAGGIGLDAFRIGLMSTVYGIVGMIIQFLVFPPLCRKFGVLFWFKVVSCLFPIVYLITPFTALLPTNPLRITALLLVMLLKSWCVIFAFPCNIILLTNSANSLRILGTLNGFATTMSAVGRAAGPAIGGALFTLGMKRGYLIASFWFLSGVSLLGVVTVFYIVDGEGFEANDQEDEEGEEGEDNEQSQRESDGLQSAAADGQAQVAGRPGPMLAPIAKVGEENHDEETRSGNAPPHYRAMASSDAIDSGEESEGGLLGYSSRRTTNTSHHEETSSGGTWETSKQVTRRTSNPIGMGSKGISRKYSTNLGQGLSGHGSYQES